MRRLARRVFRFCSAVSFVLFVAACVLWVRGENAREQLEFSAEGSSVTFHIFWSLGDIACTTTIVPDDNRDSGKATFTYHTTPTFDIYQYWRTGLASSRNGVVGMASHTCRV